MEMRFSSGTTIENQELGTLSGFGHVDDRNKITSSLMQDSKDLLLIHSDLDGKTNGIPQMDSGLVSDGEPCNGSSVGEMEIQPVISPPCCLGSEKSSCLSKTMDVTLLHETGSSSGALLNLLLSSNINEEVVQAYSDPDNQNNNNNNGSDSIIKRGIPLYNQSNISINNSSSNTRTRGEFPNSSYFSLTSSDPSAKRLEQATTPLSTSSKAKVIILKVSPPLNRSETTTEASEEGNESASSELLSGSKILIENTSTLHDSILPKLQMKLKKPRSSSLGSSDVSSSKVAEDEESNTMSPLSANKGQLKLKKRRHSIHVEVDLVNKSIVTSASSSYSSKHGSKKYRKSSISPKPKKSKATNLEAIPDKEPEFQEMEKEETFEEKKQLFVTLILPPVAKQLSKTKSRKKSPASSSVDSNGPESHPVEVAIPVFEEDELGADDELLIIKQKALKKREKKRQEQQQQQQMEKKVNFEQADQATAIKITNKKDEEKTPSKKKRKSSVSSSNKNNQQNAMSDNLKETSSISYSELNDQSDHEPVASVTTRGKSKRKPASSSPLPQSSSEEKSSLVPPASSSSPKKKVRLEASSPSVKKVLSKGSSREPSPPIPEETKALRSSTRVALSRSSTPTNKKKSVEPNKAVKVEEIPKPLEVIDPIEFESIMKTGVVIKNKKKLKVKSSNNNNNNNENDKEKWSISPSEDGFADPTSKGKGNSNNSSTLNKQNENNAKANSISSNNRDYCQTCHESGTFICCEGCPKSFHFICAEPPVDPERMPKGSWFCKQCRYRKVLSMRPSPRPRRRQEFDHLPSDGTDDEFSSLHQTQWHRPLISAIFNELIDGMESMDPQHFRLPTEVEEYFENVGCDPWTGNYVDLMEYQGRFVEEPTSFSAGSNNTSSAASFRPRFVIVPSAPISNNLLKDWISREEQGKVVEDGKKVNQSRVSKDPCPSVSNGFEATFPLVVGNNGNVILCFKCSRSSLHGSLIRCDYCPLFFHWDCLDPPLTFPPKRWMCPNHCHQVIEPCRRIKAKSKKQLPESGRKKSSSSSTNNSTLSAMEEEDDSPPLLVVKTRNPSNLVARDHNNRFVSTRSNIQLDEMKWLKAVYEIPEEAIQLAFLRKIHQSREGEETTETENVILQDNEEANDEQEEEEKGGEEERGEEERGEEEREEDTRLWLESLVSLQSSIKDYLQQSRPPRAKRQA